MENFFPLFSFDSPFRPAIVTTNIYSWRWFTIGKLFFSSFLSGANCAKKISIPLRKCNFRPHCLESFISFEFSSEKRGKRGGETVKVSGKSIINEWKCFSFLLNLVGNLYGHWFRARKESLMCTPRKKKFFFHMKSDTQMRRRSFFCDMRRFSGSRKKNFHVFFLLFFCPDKWKREIKFVQSCKTLFLCFSFSIFWEIWGTFSGQCLRKLRVKQWNEVKTSGKKKSVLAHIAFLSVNPRKNRHIQEEKRERKGD